MSTARTTILPPQRGHRKDSRTARIGFLTQPAVGLLPIPARSLVPVVDSVSAGALGAQNTL